MQVTWQASSPGEGFQQLYGQRAGFMLNDSSLNATEGAGLCSALETNFIEAPPMINQVSTGQMLELHPLDKSQPPGMVSESCFVM